MINGMHLTPIGDSNVLLEPGEGLDPSNTDDYMDMVARFMQQHRIRRLIYDLGNVRMIDQVYYAWLVKLHSLCKVSSVEMVAVNITPAAAFSLSMIIDGRPPFACKLDVDRARGLT
ncbi:MAG: STAS domain-containing protein [Gammaproteobacteria bacterium]|nr:STAS domain-containing protein [Gammaproteobacteria bacterium]